MAIVIILLVGMVPFLIYMFYLIIKNAVENGVYDALKKIENEKDDNSKNDAGES